MPKVLKNFEILGMINKVLALDIGGGTGGVDLENPLKSNSIIEIISNVLNWLIIYSVPILAIMILIGGFQILTAKESPEKVANGRKTIMYAVIGFTVILISKGVALILLNIIG
jgi:predicted small integral membrane protein